MPRLVGDVVGLAVKAVGFRSRQISESLNRVLRKAAVP